MSTPFAEVAVEAARAAGALSLKHYDTQKKVSVKADNTLVSDIDLAAEEIIKDTIHEHFPDHGIFGEETGLETEAADYTWVIDPIDGTTNFLSRLHNFAVSIALQHKGVLQLGVVYNPLVDELLVAETGHGVTRNGKAASVRDTANLNEALVLVDRTKGPEERRFTEIFGAITPHVRSTRAIMCCSVSLARLAAGDADAFIHVNTKYYDAAAGVVVAQEAGAVVTDFTGQPWNPDLQGSQDLLATTPQLQPLLLNILQTI